MSVMGTRRLTNNGCYLSRHMSGMASQLTRNSTVSSTAGSVYHKTRNSVLLALFNRNTPVWIGFQPQTGNDKNGSMLWRHYRFTTRVQYLDYWCPGSLRRLEISIHDTTARQRSYSYAMILMSGAIQFREMDTRKRELPFAHLFNIIHHVKRKRKSHHDIMPSQNVRS